jgi:hypothetical protein
LAIGSRALAEGGATFALRAGPAMIVVLVALIVLPSRAFGASWRTEATVTPAGLANAQLSGVSCVSATSCIAIGDGNAGVTSSGAAIDPAVLAEGWNGTAWALQPITTPGDETPSLASVSCISAAFCVTVGQTGATAGLASGFSVPGIPASDGGSAPLIEVWNGATWTAQPTQSGAGKDSGLYGVDCLSTRFCVAVGARNIKSTNPGAMAEIWNGARWRIVKTASLPGEDTLLAGVSCTATDACTAVGMDYTSYPRSPVGDEDALPLTERWNGRRWLAQPRPSGYLRPLGGYGAVLLSAVACTSRSSCVAVGYRSPQNGAASPYAQRWNGRTWTTTTAGLARWGFLNGVACASTTVCTAVGRFDPSDFPAASATEPLAVQWNGARWQRQAVQPATAPSGGFGSFGPPELVGISCTATNECTAVGSRGAGKQVAPLAESDTTSGPSAVA